MWGHSSTETVTLVVEQQYGDPVDLDQVDAWLRENDLKLRTWADGDHMLWTGALKRKTDELVQTLQIASSVASRSPGEALGIFRSWKARHKHLVGDAALALSRHSDGCLWCGVLAQPGEARVYGELWLADCAEVPVWHPRGA